MTCIDCGHPPRDHAILPTTFCMVSGCSCKALKEPTWWPYRSVALVDLDDGPLEQVTFVEAPDDE